MMFTAKNNLIYADDYDQLARELQAENKKGHHQMANHVEMGPALDYAESQGCFFSSYLITVFSASPISARLRTVFTPAASSAANFSSAVPLPPAMIAPA